MSLTKSGAIAAALAFSLFQMAPAQAELISNGGFESGLTGWTVTGPNTSGCGRNFNVSTSGSAAGCTGYAPIPAGFVAPHSGTNAAYAAFDGAGPLHHTITETFAVPLSTGAATLSWYDAIGFGKGWTFRQPRIYSVNLFNSSDALVGTLFSESFTNPAAGTFQNWTNHTVDLSPYMASLSGTNAKIQFDLFIPQVSTGPGAFGLDDVSILETAAVPEPASIALLLLGVAGVAVARRRRA